MDLDVRRRFYAEEVEAVCAIKSPLLVHALAAVPRERFLGPGPWLVMGQGDIAGPPRQTPDADPRHVYHNYSIALDPGRMLFNGAPGVVSVGLDALGLQQGDRVLHVGAGTGYYSAVIGASVGATGRVLAIEVDADLATRARANLQDMPWVEVRHADATNLEGEAFDAIYSSAGVTHPPDPWLDALSAGGRLVLPVTFSVPQMGNIGKGVYALIARAEGADFTARPVTVVAIYSATAFRDDALNDRLREAMTRSFWPTFSRLRRDPHEPTSSCWLHGRTSCLT